MLSSLVVLTTADDSTTQPPPHSHTEDARARWLGYQDAGHYLERAADHLARRKTPDRWVWSHYRAIFMGQMRGAVR